MKPVDQTKFGVPDGNCLAACIASILECPIDAVCRFRDGPGQWMEDLLTWLRPHGLYAVSFHLEPGWRPPGIYILAGRSPRGDFEHAVVAAGDRLLHDPHPSRAGLVTETNAIVFVPFNPRMS